MKPTLQPHGVEPQNKLIEEMGDMFGCPSSIVAPSPAHAALAYCEHFSNGLARDNVKDEPMAFDLVVQQSDGSESVFAVKVSRTLIEVNRVPFGYNWRQQKYWLN